MDDFVRDKLSEWKLSKFIDTFKEQGIDKDSIYCLDDEDIHHLFPTIGPRRNQKQKIPKSLIHLLK
ncbi:hypothetical protein EYF80_060375 [Liparis tanakae]|uniref:Uncharacterized protein n=1 Tax=Liparis tanakae TaxID=230148 RepID=A0A4Z2EKQ8_9TELE|nr:hypothetical protein EYF80_060375 [Liparis tanakae]